MVLVLQELSKITLSQPYRKFEHGRKCGDLSTGERKHPVKVTSPPGTRKPPTWKNLARSPVAAGDAGILPDNNNHVRTDYYGDPPPPAPADGTTRPTLSATIPEQHKWDLQESLMGLTCPDGSVRSRFKL